MGRVHAAAVAEAHGKTLPGDEKRPSPRAPEKPKKDLDDAAVQAAIFDPETKTVTFVNGYTLKLNEPSLRDRKRIFGFALQVLGDAASLPGVSKGLLALRTVSLLTKREDLETELYFWTAKLFGPAGTISDEQAREFAQEIAKNAGPKDAGPLFDALATIAGADFPKN